jgi:hypothetical protein
MALACTSSMSSSAMSPLRASSTSGLRRMRAMTAVDVGLALGLGEAEARTPLDDLDLVGHPVGDELVDRQRARHTVDEGQHVGREVGLQLGVLEQVVQHHARDGVALEDDDQALTGARAGVVADVGDALDATGVGELGDLQREVVRVDHVGELADHEHRAALGVLVDLHHRTLGDRPAAGAVGLLDALAAHDERAVGEVRALDPLDERVLQLLAAGVGVLERPDRTLGDLAQVVRRDVGRHAHSDAGRAVDQQVGEARGQDGRLLGATVVVGTEVDGVLVDVAHHLHGQRRHPALGVPHGGGRVVARRAEVALPVDQRRTQHPRLRETDHGVVDRGVAVRVVLTHHVADDARALREAAVGAVAAVVHRVEDPAVHRLEPVAHVGQRTPDDHRHRVVDVGLLHQRLQLDRLDAVVAAAVARAAGDVGGDLGHSRALLSCLRLRLDSGIRLHRSRVTGASARLDRRWLRCPGTSRPWRCAG